MKQIFQFPRAVKRDPALKSQVGPVLENIRRGRLRSLGLGITQVPDDVREYLSIKDGVGLSVSQVKLKSPAEKAGIHRKDIIVTIQGKDADQLAFDESLTRGTLELGILRKGKAESFETQQHQRDRL